MLKIGLTGGIGSGKTTIANLFAEKHAPLIDTDIIAHELVVRGSAALAKIVSHFGNDVLKENGELDRAVLREIVFNAMDQKRELESILHPFVFKEIDKQLGELNADYCIVVIPLLIESGCERYVDRILVVDCPLDLQIERVTNRDSLDRDQVIQIIHAQSSRSEKFSIADDVIVNDNGITKIREEVQRLHELYLAMANQRCMNG